jgi:hypothetical protein
MSEVISTNPAERALNFIGDFRRSSAGTNGIRDRRVRHALASMYGLRIGDTSSLMIVLSDAWKLPVQIRESIERIGLDSEAFEHVATDLEKTLTAMALDSQAQAIVIPPNLPASLGMISSILDKDLPEAMLTREKIDELLKSITDLEEEVRAADFDKEFADYILHQADSIKYALSHYETLGPNEVMVRVDQMFGGVLRQYSQLRATKKKSSFVSKLVQIGTSIVLAINAANGVFELSDNLSKFIDSGIQIEAEPVNNLTPKVDDPEKVIA